jgi:hypothetical protein
MKNEKKKTVDDLVNEIVDAISIEEKKPIYKNRTVRLAKPSGTTPSESVYSGESRPHVSYRRRTTPSESVSSGESRY